MRKRSDYRQCREWNTQKFIVKELSHYKAQIKGYHGERAGCKWTTVTKQSQSFWCVLTGKACDILQQLHFSLFFFVISRQEISNISYYSTAVHTCEMRWATPSILNFHFSYSKASNILSPLDSQHHQSFSDLLFIFFFSYHIFFSFIFSFLQQHSKTCVPFACHAPHHTFDGWSYEWVTAERTSFKIHSLRLQQASGCAEKNSNKNISSISMFFYAVAIRYISPLSLPMYWLFNLKTE